MKDLFKEIQKVFHEMKIECCITQSRTKTIYIGRGKDGMMHGKDLSYIIKWCEVNNLRFYLDFDENSLVIFQM